MECEEGAVPDDLDEKTQKLLNESERLMGKIQAYQEGDDDNCFGVDKRFEKTVM